MVQVKDLTELTVGDLWREVKDEADWWGEVKADIIRGVKRLLESALEEELRAGKYKRTELRRSQRNGYRQRSLLTVYGCIPQLRVPRDRDCHYQPGVLGRYQQRQGEVDRLVRDVFLAGIGTRRVSEVLAPVLGETISPQTISGIARSLDAEVRRYHDRSLQDSYHYLLLDGITLRVKGATGARSNWCCVPMVLALKGSEPCSASARPRPRARRSGRPSCAISTTAG